VAPKIWIGIDCNDLETLSEFWSEALGYAIGDLDGDGVYLDLVPPSPDLPVVYLQLVPEAKKTKNRVHLDLIVDEPQAEVERLLRLGATLVGTPQTGSEGGWWQVLADPEGNELCICLAD
jgi:predicted enzyme related to lactoylglutathione lyase